MLTQQTGKCLFTSFFFFTLSPHNTFDPDHMARLNRITVSQCNKVSRTKQSEDQQVNQAKSGSIRHGFNISTREYDTVMICRK